MDVNDDAGKLIPSGVLTSIASKLAPTGGSGEQEICINALDKDYALACFFILKPAP